MSRLSTEKKTVYLTCYRYVHIALYRNLCLRSSSVEIGGCVFSRWLGTFFAVVCSDLVCSFGKLLQSGLNSQRNEIRLFTRQSDKDVLSIYVVHRTQWLNTK